MGRPDGEAEARTRLMSQDPCPCHACVVANVGRPSVTIPACRYRPAEELHGKALRDYWEAREALEATIARLRAQGIGSRSERPTGGQKP